MWQSQTSPHRLAGPSRVDAIEIRIRSRLIQLSKSFLQTTTRTNRSIAIHQTNDSRRVCVFRIVGTADRKIKRDLASNALECWQRCRATGTGVLVSEMFTPIAATWRNMNRNDVC